MRRIPKMARVMCVAALAMMLSSCVKMDMDMKVGKDDKISGTAIMAFSTQILELTGQTKAEVVKSIKEDWKKRPKGTKAEIFDKDGFVGEKITFSGVSPSELSTVLDSASGSSPTSGNDDLKLVKENGNWKMTGVMDLAGDTASGDADMAMMKGLKIKIKMTFPGKIIKHDKDGKVSGNTIVWEPKAGQKVVMLAIAKSS